MKRALRLGLATIFGIVLWVAVRSEWLLDQDHRSERLPAVSAPPPSTAPATDDEIALGEHLGEALLQCGFCHGDDLGGAEVVDDFAIGRLFAPNLTRGQGGFAAEASLADWDRAIRRGQRRDGRSLLVKPAADHAALEDDELRAIVAWLRARPPVDRVSPERRVGWLTRTVLAFGLADDLLAARPTAPATTPTTEGDRLIALGNCRVCHGPDLQGGLHPLALPEEPTPPDLRPGGALTHWTRDDFAHAMQTGRTPDGRTLDPTYMPWPRYAKLTDTEIDALWSTLRAAR